MRAAARRGALLLLSTFYIGALASDQMTEALAAALQAQAQRMEEAHRTELAALTARLHEQSAPRSQQHLTVTADGGVRIASGEHVDSLQRTLEAAVSTASRVVALRKEHRSSAITRSGPLVEEERSMKRTTSSQGKVALPLLAPAFGTVGSCSLVPLLRLLRLTRCDCRGPPLDARRGRGPLRFVGASKIM